MKALVVDLTHADISIEKEVFYKYNIECDCAFLRTEEEVIAGAQGYDAILVAYTKFTQRVLENLKSLKIIIKYGVGVDNIDVAAAKKLGIVVANVPDYCTEEVALHASALTLASVRNLVYFNNGINESKWLQPRGLRRMSNLRLGLLGFGRIARQYAEYMSSMVKNISFFDPYLKNTNLVKIEQVSSMEGIFETCDIIALFLPLNEGTRDIINTKLLSKGKNVVLINTSRGGLVNLNDIKDAIEKKYLSFFATDVWPEEPMNFDQELSKQMLSFDNIIITPHVAWQSEESEYDLRYKAAQEISIFLTTGISKNRLN